MIEQLKIIPAATIEYYGTLILLFWILFIILLEHYYPYTKGLKFFRKGFWTDFIWYTLIQSYFLKIIIFDYIILPIKKEILPNGVDWFNNQSMLFLLLFFLITHDFYIYLFHKFQHSNKFLWRTHEAHHSGKECDWLTGSRSHFLEILINQTVEFLPIFILLDFDLAMHIVPIKALLDAIFGLWIHANTKVDIGVLKYFINSPQMHQWHHSNHKEVFYANYATKFSFFDFLFKTAYLPRNSKVKPLLFGLPYIYPNDFFLQTCYSMVRFPVIVKKMEKIGNFSEKIRRSLFEIITPKSFHKYLTCFLFDSSNQKYRINICGKCGSALNTYYFEQKFCKVCNYCTNIPIIDERR